MPCELRAEGGCSRLGEALRLRGIVVDLLSFQQWLKFRGVEFTVKQT